MNVELKIERVRREISRAKAIGAPIDDLKALELRLNNLWIRLMALK